jgi:hypothetical protein
MNKLELQNQSKVVDMMLTMHSILASRYKFRAQVLELSILGISIVLVATIFLDPQIISFFHTNTKSTRVLIGVCSILVFFFSIVSLIVDWKGRATQHREAFKILIPLKTEWREVLASYGENDERSRTEFVRKSSLIIGNLIPIPDAKFNKLKAYHYKKVELSKLISDHPGSSIIFLKLRIWLKSNWKAIKNNPSN